MKKLITLFFILGLALIGQAQVSKTINISTAGTLSTALTSVELNTVTNLTLTGTIDARDFVILRDSMPILAVLDISAVNIVAFTGTTGTGGTTSQTYPGNEIPKNSFCNQNTSLGKTSLKTITFPNSITSIGSDSFYNCSGLIGTLIIPNSVTSIGIESFGFCSGITSLLLSNTLTTIGDYAFINCSNLLSVTIPGSVTSLGFRSFNWCFGLTQFIVENQNLNYSAIDGVLFNKNQTSLIQFPGGKAGNYVIPSTVSSIAMYAFYGCGNVTTISIPNSVNSIGSRALGYCNSVTDFIVPSDSPYLSVIDGVLFNKNQTELIQCPAGKSGIYYVPYTVNIIRESGFIRCNKLTSIYIISPQVKTIEPYTFFYCTAMTDIAFYSASIGDYAFYNCSALTSFRIDAYSAHTNYIGDYAFNNCSALTSFRIPIETNYIGNYAFANCRNLTSIFADSSYPVDLRFVYGVFDNHFCYLIVPYHSKSLYSSADQWKNMFISESSDGILLGTNKLNLPATSGNNQVSITANDYWAAQSDQSWLSVTPNRGNGDNILTLTYQANQTTSARIATISVFWGDRTQIITIKQDGLQKSVHVTAGTLSSLLTADELATVTNLTITGTIDARDFKTMRDNMPLLADLDLSGVIIVAYSGTAGPAGVKATVSNAKNTAIEPDFDNPLSKMHTQQVPLLAKATATTVYPANEIPQNAFYKYPGKTSLKAVSMPSSVTTIGDGAFYFCRGLTSVTIPSSVTSVGSWAFGNCSGLTSVTIPSSVTSIGSNAFAYCSNLTSIYAYSTVPVNISASSYVFFNVNKTTCTLYVPTGTKSAYQAAVQWKDFTNIVEFVTAVPALSDDGSMQVYPNPVTDGFRIKDVEGIAKLTLMNLNGKVLLTRQVTGNETISVNNLPQGIYIVKIITSEGKIERKMVKK